MTDGTERAVLPPCATAPRPDQPRITRSATETCRVLRL